MLSFLKGYSQYEAMNIRQEIVKRLRQRLTEMGYRNVQLRIDEVAQREQKIFCLKNGRDTVLSVAEYFMVEEQDRPSHS